MNKEIILTTILILVTIVLELIEYMSQSDILMYIIGAMIIIIISLYYIGISKASNSIDDDEDDD